MARKKKIAKKRSLPDNDSGEETHNVKWTKVKTSQNSKPFIINVKPIPEDALFLGAICIGTLREGCFDEDDANTICICEHESSLIYVKLNIDFKFIKGIVPAQHFTYKIEKSNDNEIQMKVYFLYLPDMELTKKVAKTNYTILSHIFSDDFSSNYNEDNFNKKHDLNEFYEAVKKVQQFQNVKFNCQLKPPQQLVPTLRPYQAAAVNWMLQKERKIKKAYCNPEYKKIVLPDKITVFYNKLTSHITIEEPFINSMPTGGILADEMGLGKTVEVLACILINPRKNIKNSVHDGCDPSNTEPIAILHDNKIKRTSVQRRRIATNASKKRSSTPVDDSDDERSLEEIRMSSRKKKSKISFDSDEEYEPNIKKKNTSDKMDEDFICQSAVPKPKGGVAKRAAQLWYESKLAEVNINPLKQRTSMTVDIQCLCGELTGHGSYVSCVQCRKRQHRQCMDYTDDKREYYCPQCWEKKPPVVSGATLIVSPNSISRQWITEIKRHIKQNGLKVLIYRGVKKAGYIYPLKLAQYDLVITTYSVLSNELNFVGVEDNHRLRFAKRYYTACSPLPMVEWWRVCLDEAQMVDCATSMVADMARQLPAIHRWAVSGTPAQHGITDLHGLVSFLGIEPYNNKAAWDKLLYIPYCYGDKDSLHNFLADIMWRSSKKEVIDQINIPKQTEQVHWLKFSAVEDFFYKREHEMCADDLKFRLNKFKSLDVTLDSIDKKTLSKLMLPLLSVRQACIHPRVVRGRYLTTVKNATSLEDLLEALISKNKIECEDSLRANIAALNGIAGIHMIQDEWNAAAEAYREVLRLVEHHNSYLKIDTLQQLHVLCNLAELLELKHPNANIPPTLRDHQLRDQANALEDKYMQKHVACIQKAEEDCTKAYNAVKNAESKFEMPVSAWIPEIIDWLGENNFTDELVERIRTTLTDYQVDKHADIKSSFTSSWKIICELSVWNDKIVKSINKLRTDFVKLKTEYENNRFSEKMVSSVVDCHLRPLNKNEHTAKKCCFCKVEANLLDYERLIFLMTTKQKKQKRKVSNSQNDEEDKNKGSWKSSQQEVVLKVILTYSQRKGVAQYLIEDGETHIKMCGALRREFKELRRLWTYYCDQIAAQDELIMCKQRLRLRLPNEPLPNQGRKLLVLKNLDYNIENKVEHINIIDPPMLDMQFQLLNTDKQTATAELSKRLGTLKYLETLSKQRYTGQNPDLCPICRNQLTDNWSVLPCGHSFCLECIHHLLEKYSCGKSVTCSVCREVQSLQNISYVRLKEDNATDNNDSIVGSYSTKIEAVVKCVLSLKRDDPDVKVLIFSTWPRVLNVMSEAFSANSITFEIFCNSGNLDQLERFKDKKEGITALLLPVHSGAKGLNLVEATHVLLIEPLLNPGEELQAIGRIHRIGQTRATVVHRFLIQNTIEENIHYAVSGNIVDWNNKDRITLRRLYNLFQEYKHNDANSSETKNE